MLEKGLADCYPWRWGSTGSWRAVSSGSLNSFAAGSPSTPAIISALPELQHLLSPLWVCSPALRLNCGAEAVSQERAIMGVWLELYFRRWGPAAHGILDQVPMVGLNEHTLLQSRCLTTLETLYYHQKGNGTFRGVLLPGHNYPTQTWLVCPHELWNEWQAQMFMFTLQTGFRRVRPTQPAHILLGAVSTQPCIAPCPEHDLRASGQEAGFSCPSPLHGVPVNRDHHMWRRDCTDEPDIAWGIDMINGTSLHLTATAKAYKISHIF